MADHWSESLGDWYYVGTVAEQLDYIRHDAEAEDLDDEVAGLYLLRRDGSSEPAPTTRAAWELLDLLTEDDDSVVCVGRVVDGMCVPIGG